jgi:hypothetical protein
MSIQPYTPDGRASQQGTDRTGRSNATTRPIATAGSRRRVGVGVDEGMLWAAGGAASAVVVGLVALVGVLVRRWLFKVPLLAPSQDGAYGDVRTTTLILVAMAAALAATALVHLLMLGTMRPLMFSAGSWPW